MNVVFQGPANENATISSKASFRYPSGIDVMKITIGKNERAYVCDKGNSSIRFITNVHSFQGDKFIGTVKIPNIPPTWKPEGLTVLPNSHTVAISESSKLFLLHLDDSFISGQLTQIIDSLQTPCGLCASPVTHDLLFIADGNSILEVNLESKNVKTVAQGFHKAFKFSFSSDNTILG